MKNKEKLLIMKVYKESWKIRNNTKIKEELAIINKSKKIYKFLKIRNYKKQNLANVD